MEEIASAWNNYRCFSTKIYVIMNKTESVKARIGVAMRKYQDNNTQLVTVICNRCKKELKVENGILKEGCFEVSHAFGYFSEKDGQVYQFDLCEQCFDKMLAEFQVPAEVKEAKELL